MRLLYYAFVIVFGVPFFCCCKGNKKDELPVNYTANSIKELTKRAIENGDTGAYYQLSLDYMDSPYDGFLRTALLMANKHGYSQAFIDVYYCLTDLSHKKDNTELDHIDEHTRKLALEYLMKGVEKGNKECMQILGHHYIEGKYLPKDEEKGNELIGSAE